MDDVEYIRATYLVHTLTTPIANVSFETQNTTSFVQFQPARIKAYDLTKDDNVMPQVVDLEHVTHDFRKAWGVARGVGELDEFENVRLVGGGEAGGWKEQGYYLFRSVGTLTRIGADDLCVDEECASDGGRSMRRRSMSDRRRALKRILRKILGEEMEH